MDTGTFYNSRWKTVSILDANYSICSIKKNSTWKICLTNLVDIWTETLSRKAIVQKCEVQQYSYKNDYTLNFYNFFYKKKLAFIKTTNY